LDAAARRIAEPGTAREIGEEHVEQLLVLGRFREAQDSANEVLRAVASRGSVAESAYLAALLSDA
jgi:hypothetical protein